MAKAPAMKSEADYQSERPQAGRTERAEEAAREFADAAAEEAPGRERLQSLVEKYSGLRREEKPHFFHLLLEGTETSPDDVLPLISEAARVKDDPEAWRRVLMEMRDRLESPRHKLFKNFVVLPDGLKFLLDFRSDLLAARGDLNADFRFLDRDLVQLFESWFQEGFLFLNEITLDSPYRQIELIKNGDMVHPMTTLEEMTRRLGRDRRCFALYHRVMPDRPVVFIEAALTRGLPDSIHKIITEEGQPDNSRPDTAVFYSINNTQNGLARLGLGKVLIFKVVEFLKQDAPEIKNFCTLSPLPGFWRRYLRPLLEGRGRNFKMTSDGLTRYFDKKSRDLLTSQYMEEGGLEGAQLPEIIRSVFSSTAWSGNKELTDSLARPLEKIGYFYLAEEKAPDGRPLDPVANFHLGNGATLSPNLVHFGANWSQMGQERSLTLMVNYVYSQQWRRQIASSMTRLQDMLPGLPRIWSDKRPSPMPRKPGAEE